MVPGAGTMNGSGEQRSGVIHVHSLHSVGSGVRPTYADIGATSRIRPAPGSRRPRMLIGLLERMRSDTQGVRPRSDRHRLHGRVAPEDSRNLDRRQSRSSLVTHQTIAGSSTRPTSRSTVCGATSTLPLTSTGRSTTYCCAARQGCRSGSPNERTTPNYSTDERALGIAEHRRA